MYKCLTQLNLILHLSLLLTKNVFFIIVEYVKHDKYLKKQLWKENNFFQDKNSRVVLSTIRQQQHWINFASWDKQNNIQRVCFTKNTTWGSHVLMLRWWWVRWTLCFTQVWFVYKTNTHKTTSTSNNLRWGVVGVFLLTSGKLDEGGPWLEVFGVSWTEASSFFHFYRNSQSSCEKNDTKTVTVCCKWQEGWLSRKLCLCVCVCVCVCPLLSKHMQMVAPSVIRSKWHLETEIRSRK